MTDSQDNKLQKFGFTFQYSGVHSSRTMMFQELKTLLSYITDNNADKDIYLKAIEEENCLGKRSVKTRTLTGRHLSELYSLDPSVTLFRSLLFFWRRDEAGQPLLSLLCAFTRDPLLRMSLPYIISVKEGEQVSREAMEKVIEKDNPDRFSRATLMSTAQNINSTWTQSGHLTGKTRKLRTRAKATPGSAAYALFLGYLRGIRGEALFDTEYVKILDCEKYKAIELAEEASMKGWIVFKHIGNIIEVLFPKLLTEEEVKLLYEQD